MRSLIIAAAVAFAAVSGVASAQDRGLAPYSQQEGAPALVQHTRAPTMPGAAARPGETTARLGPYRGRRMHHRRHRVSARVCIARANARGLRGRAKTHFIQRCEVGRR